QPASTGAKLAMRARTASPSEPTKIVGLRRIATQIALGFLVSAAERDASAIAATVLDPTSEDQPGLSVLIQRPDRSLDFGERNFAIVTAERGVRIHVDDPFRNWPECGREMVGGLANEDFALRRFDPHVPEEIEPECLRPLRNQHRLDAVDLHGRAITKRHPRWAEILPAVCRKLCHLHDGVDGNA